MRIASVIIFLILLTTACDTERSFPIPEENYFVKFYGEEGEQEGVDFIVNSDGTVVMVGNSWTREDKRDQQVYVVKVDPNGIMIWQRKIGLIDKADIAKDIELHQDGRIVIAGETEITTNNHDVYLKTLTQDGLELDSVRYGLNNGSVDTNEIVNSVTIINGGGGFLPGFIITGSTTLVATPDVRDLHDALFLRFDNTLNRILETGTSPIWGPPSYGYTSDDIAFKIIEFDFNTYYVFGYSNRIIQNYNGDYNYWYFALSGDGKIKLSENYLGKNSEDEILTSLEIASPQAGGGYVLGGTATGSGNTTQAYSTMLSTILKFNANDIIRETNPTDLGDNLNGDQLVKVQPLQTNDSFLLISTDTQIPNQGYNIALTKLKFNLLKEWSQTLIFGGEGDDFAGSVAELPDGRILLMGTMTIGQSTTPGQKKMALIKLNPNGKLAE
jgi:hypothetical protein